jgi:hypothetical protein
MGTPWAQQTGTRSLSELVRTGRQMVAEGRFNRTAMDHNHPDYDGRLSNKEVMIASAKILGRQPVNYDEAWDVFAEMVCGR